MTKNRNAIQRYGQDDEGDDEKREQKFFGSLHSRRTIPVLSAGMNVELNASQRVTALGAPLTSFENPVLDDLLRDVFEVFYTYQFGLFETPPDGREENRKLLEWLLADPLIDKRRLPFMNFNISAAAAAYEVVTQLLDVPTIKVVMGGLGKAEVMEDEADEIERAISHPNVQVEFEPGEGEDEEDGQDGEDQFSDEDADGQWRDEEDDREGSGDGEDEDQDDQPELDEAPEPTAEEMQEQANDLRGKAQKIRQKCEKRLDTLLAGEFNGFNRSGALQSGQQFGEAVKNFLSSWGFEEGPGVVLSVEEIRELMRLMGGNNLGMLTALMGRVYGVAMHVMEGRSPQEIWINSSGMTKNPLDLFPDQMALLANGDPDLEAYYMAEFIRDGMEGVVKVSQAKREGIFIGGDDGSGSMESYMDAGDGNMVERRVVAKALALGLARAARENRQKFYLATFGSYNQLSDIVHNNTPLPELLKWGTFNFGGGTSFDYALKMYMDMFEAQDEEDRYLSDILMITDGDAGLHEDTIARFEWLREKYGVRLHLLLIGEDSENVLEAIADTLIQFTDLTHIAEQLASAIWQVDSQE